jgi:hypothetical protein
MWFRAGATAAVNLGFYQRVVNQLFLTLNIGDKPQFEGQSWYFPAGGGIEGFDSGGQVVNNGSATKQAILKFAKPIPIPARQHFFVQASFHDLGADSVRTDLNGTDADRELAVLIDGIHTRDVL